MDLSRGDFLPRLLQILVVVLCLAAAGLPAGRAAAQSASTVQEVVIDGAQRIEAETIRSYLLIREGDPFDPLRINRSLKSLFATGLFADVTIRRRGDALVVSVVENPVINRIAFEGNKHLEDKDLEAELTLKPRVIYTRSKVQADVRRILTLYRHSGRFSATVEPKVIQLPQNRVDMVFEISEGDPTEIRRIRFIGNREFDDGDLRDVIRTKETRWYRFFSSDDRYDPDRLTLDRELLRRYYLKEGFADFRVVSAVAELTPDQKDFFVTFAVDEGPRYTFGKIETNVTLRNLQPEVAKEPVEIESGDWYNADAVDKTVEAINLAVSGAGFPFVDVRPRVNRNRDNRTIDVAFEVGEGPRVFVERVDITGNVRTEDKVIRREFRLVEGDAFNAAKLNRSRQRIQNLGFFGKVQIDQVPGSAPDKTVIDVKVEEKSTGALTFGAGYSTSSGPLGDITIREKNLLGKGLDAKLGLTVAGKGTQVDFSFTDPYFLDRELSAGADVFWVKQDLQDSQSHDVKKQGFALRTNYPLTDAVKQGFTYTFLVTDVYNVASDASRFIKASEGRASLSQVSHFVSYDTRDSRFDPTEGFYARLTNDVAGAGGSKHFLRNKVTAAKFFPLADQWVLELSGDVGIITGIGEDVGLTDRFFVGGDNLRGFRTGGIGPRDISTNDALGGEIFYTGTVQTTFPLGLPTEVPVVGRAFTDFGSLTQLADSGSEVKDSGNIRAASGVGFTWRSGFGPIGFDLAVPWLKESYDREELFRINFGTRF